MFAEIVIFDCTDFVVYLVIAYTGIVGFIAGYWFRDYKGDQRKDKKE